MKTYIRAGAAMSAVAATLALPAAAGAAGLAITGDDGNPVSLTEGTTAQIRYMTPKVMPSFDGSEGQYSLGVKDPDGSPVNPAVDCQAVTSPATPESIEFRGNGTYTVTLRTYADPSDVSCTNPTTTQTFTFTITATTAVQAPGTVLATRKPNSTNDIFYRFRTALNPGAVTYEFRWSTHPVFDADGGLGDASDFDAADFDATGTDRLSFSAPGVYTFVARPLASPGGGSWCTPVKVKFVGPFDFSSTPLFFTVDAKAPNYEMSATIGDGHSAVGKPVVVSIAKGNGSFRPLAKPKIDSDGNITLKFRQKGGGRYRLRYAFKGSQLVKAGTWIQKVTLGSRPTAEPKLTRG